MIRNATIAATLWVVFSSIGVADWNSCASDLNRVQRAARDASDKAEALSSKEREVESVKSTYDEARDRFDRCRRFPETYDTYSDQCDTLRRRARSAQQDYESAKSDYDSAVQEVQTSINDVRTYTRRIESSCADGSGGGMDPAKFCTTIKALKGKYPDAELLEACKARMPEALCRTCLGMQ